MSNTAIPTSIDHSPQISEATPPTTPTSNWVGAGILAVWIALGVGLVAAPRPPHLVTFLFVMTGWLLAVMAHEFSHALVAWAAGDHTVKTKGYLDFDPRRYGSLQTTLVIPVLALAMGGIGFPGGSVYLREDLMRGRLWRAAAALAGPAATAVILLVLTSALRLWANVGAVGDLYPALSMLAYLQAMALILNLLPLPGFDGFNAVRPFLPLSFVAVVRRSQAIAPLVLLLLIFFTPAGGLLMRASISLGAALGLLPEAVRDGWVAFHFWR